MRKECRILSANEDATCFNSVFKVVDNDDDDNDDVLVWGVR